MTVSYSFETPSFFPTNLNHFRIFMSKLKTDKIMRRLFIISVLIGAFTLSAVPARAQVGIRVRPVVKTVVVKPVMARKGYVWVGRHWKWGPGKNRYVWVQGRYKRVRPGYAWVWGYWVKLRVGWR